MKTKTVIINGKQFTIAEMRNKEIQQMLEKYKAEFLGAEVTGLEGLVSAVYEFIKTKLQEIIPGLTAEDIDNAYPSEIDEAVEAFLTLNFPLARRFGGPLMTLVQLAAKK